MNINPKLLAKYFANEVNDQERGMIEKWAVANKKEFLIQENIWRISAKANIKLFDTKIAREKVRPTKNSLIDIRPLRWVGIAASILLLISMFSIIQFNTSSKLLEEVGLNEPALLVLPDGSEVWLKSGARLKYPEYFEGDVRSVSLIGEAYFDVRRDENQPFVIEGAVGNVRVLGTSFDLIMDSVSASVIMESGEVVLTSLEGERLHLTAGFSAEIKKGQMRRYTTVGQNALAWLTKIVHFDGTPLIKALDDLKVIYPNQITVDPKFSSDCSISATFQDQSLDEIMQVIGLSCDLKIERKEDSYIFL